MKERLGGKEGEDERKCAYVCVGGGIRGTFSHTPTFT